MFFFQYRDAGSGAGQERTVGDYLHLDIIVVSFVRCDHIILVEALKVKHGTYTGGGE